MQRNDAFRTHQTKQRVGGADLLGCGRVSALPPLQCTEILGQASLHEQLQSLLHSGHARCKKGLQNIAAAKCRLRRVLRPAQSGSRVARRMPRKLPAQPHTKGEGKGFEMKLHNALLDKHTHASNAHETTDTLSNPPPETKTTQPRIHCRLEKLTLQTRAH